MKQYMEECRSLEEFDQIIQEPKVSVMLFSAAWCPDCVFLKTFIGKLVEKYQQYHFVYVDRDQFLSICQDYDVLGIPSFVAFKSGREIGRLVSKLRKSEAEVDAFLEGLENE